MAYTEFYCNFATGDNINAGDGAATISTTTNGAYTQGGGAGGTDIFVATGGTPLSTAVAGDFVSVYNDAAAVTTFTGRITAVNLGGLSVDISLTAIAGTRPATAANGKTATIGGVWKGPNAAVNFPFSHVAATLTNASGNYPRVNLKNGSTYAITSAITHAVAGPMVWQGYTTTVGDGGRALIDCATVGASIVIITTSCNNNSFIDLIYSNSGATSTSSDGVVNSGTENYFLRCVVHDVRRDGFVHSGTTVVFEECETYLCNKGNSGGKGGFNFTTNFFAIRCIAHDNAGSAAQGFIVAGSGSMINCIADTNGANGCVCSATSTAIFSGCDFYANGAAGIDSTGASASLLVIENCNFIKNTTWGITSSGSSIRNGAIINCGFGAGTEANGSGNINTNTGAIIEIGSVNYASNVTPWNAPTTGDFRIALAAAKAAGRGAFTETQASYTGTVGYPDIGAAQHLEAASGGGSFGFIG